MTKAGIFILLGSLFVMSAVTSQALSTNGQDPVLQKLGLGNGFGNCEINSATLDNVRSGAEEQNVTVIAIARLGKGEISRELNRRRLYTIRAYLSRRGVRSEKLILTEGDRVGGYGRVDFYVEGKLFAALVADTYKDLPVGDCTENPYANPYYLPRKGKSRWCR